jgi:hypothetical protein
VPLQTSSQKPQWSFVLERSTQFVPHCTWPAGQLKTQVPPTQVAPTGHVAPHAPQFATLAWTSKQAPSQYARPPGHAHFPALQCAPPRAGDTAGAAVQVVRGQIDTRAAAAAARETARATDGARALALAIQKHADARGTAERYGAKRGAGADWSWWRGGRAAAAWGEVGAPVAGGYPPRAVMRRRAGCNWTPAPPRGLRSVPREAQLVG